MNNNAMPDKSTAEGEVPYTGTGRQIYQVGDQWQIGSPQTGQQYTQGDTQQGVYGTGADQWQTVKEQQPYGASQYDQNNGNGAWQQCEKCKN